MKILVTGSEGSLMQAVIPHLRAAGHDVRGVDNFFRHGKTVRARDYELVEGDLTDPRLAREVVRGVDGVLQSAARIFGVGGFHKYPADILAHDVTLHRNVLLAALEEGIGKVAYVSSSMVYERAPRQPTSEADADEAVIPSTDYGLSKLVGERLSKAFRRQYGLTYVVWRPFNVITPYERAEAEQGVGHVFADFIERIVVERANPLPILGDGQQVRCFTWIDDVARTIAAYSFDPRTDDEVYNLGNPEPITMIELANMIQEEAKALGRLPKDAPPLSFRTVGSFADDVRVRIPDVTKATIQLGWTPTVKVREAVRRCIAALPRGA